MELRQHCLALKAEHGIRMKRVPIPREIMEKNRKSPPPFLKMAVLEAEAVTRTEGGKKNRGGEVDEIPALTGRGSEKHFKNGRSVAASISSTSGR